MAGKFTLHYFEHRGTGEVIRQIFAVAGQEFVDNRIPKSDWPKLKSSTPFEQLPCLEIDSRLIPQSHAIARFVAKKFGLNGKNKWEEAQVNAVADQFKDYMADVRPLFKVMRGILAGDAEKMKNEFFLPAFNKNFPFFQRILKENGTGYLVGSSLTWADLLLAEHVADLIYHKLGNLEKFPELLVHQKKVHSNENLKKWLETRPFTEF